MAKELTLISVLTSGGEQPGPHCHSAGRKVLGLTTFAGLWRPLSFRISRGLLPRYNQPQFHYHSFQTCNSPMVLFSPHHINQNAGLNSLLKIKTRIRAFKCTRTLKPVFPVQRILRYSSHPYTKGFLTNIPAKRNAVLTYLIFGIRITYLLRHLTDVCINLK